MGMSAVERMRKYRENSLKNPENIHNISTKKSRKTNGEIRNINDCNEGEKRIIRKKLSNAKENCEKREKRRIYLLPSHHHKEVREVKLSVNQEKREGIK